MLIDVNTYIGHWPFRQLRDNTAAGLLKRMDRAGIDRAVVGSIDAVFYKDVLPANEALAKATRRHRDRLLPAATLNPLYPGWREDLRRCAEDWDLKALRLYPQYHGYRLGDIEALRLIDAAAELGWVVQVPMRLVDRRQRHPQDWAADLSGAALVEAVALRPWVKWMFLDALGLDGRAFPKEASYLVEVSRMTAVLQRNIQGLIAAAGIEHLAFGSGLPFKVAEPTLLKLEVLDISQRLRERIAWRNAAKMLGWGRN